MNCPNPGRELRTTMICAKTSQCRAVILSEFAMRMIGGFHKLAVLSTIALFPIFLAGMSSIKFILLRIPNNPEMTFFISLTPDLKRHIPMRQRKPIRLGFSKNQRLLEIVSFLIYEILNVSSSGLLHQSKEL